MPGLPLEALGPLFVFSLVSSITPGPNNLMLLSSGVNFGLRRSVWHMMGICIGFWVLLLSVGFGLGAVIQTVPGAQLGLKVIGGTYLLFLSWKIALTRSMSTDGGDNSSGKPMSFLAAALFQWVNVKAWMMAVTAMSLYANAAENPWSVVSVACVFAAVNLPSVSIWAGFGVALRETLSDPVKLKWFNIAMGIALALTIIPMVM